MKIKSNCTILLEIPDRTKHMDLTQDMDLIKIQNC